jgi:hypothetical protein
MSKRILLLFAVMFLWASGAQATPIFYSATLSGAAENPSNGSPGTGTAIVGYDPIAQTLSVDVSFSGLLGPITASHIHCCVDPPGNVGVATPVPTFTGFPSGVTAGSYSHLFDLTLASSFNPSFVTANGSVAAAEAALADGLENGRAYLNIHTTTYPGGEIRGFLASVPEPATLSLLVVGLGMLVLLRRKRSV